MIASEQLNKAWKKANALRLRADACIADNDYAGARAAYREAHDAYIAWVDLVERHKAERDELQRIRDAQPEWLEQANRNPHNFHITAEYEGGRRGYYASAHSIQFAMVRAHKVRAGIVYDRKGEIVYQAG